MNYAGINRHPPVAYPINGIGSVQQRRWHGFADHAIVFDK
ncbi:MAG: hypothetical protein XXXNARYT_001872 [Candidatus Accumulibacter regalis]|jgi:hypothetical protein